MNTNLDGWKNIFSRDRRKNFKILKLFCASGSKEKSWAESWIKLNKDWAEFCENEMSNTNSYFKGKKIGQTFPKYLAKDWSKWSSKKYVNMLSSPWISVDKRDCFWHQRSTVQFRSKANFTKHVFNIVKPRTKTKEAGNLDNRMRSSS